METASLGHNISAHRQGFYTMASRKLAGLFLCMLLSCAMLAIQGHHGMMGGLLGGGGGKHGGGGMGGVEALLAAGILAKLLSNHHHGGGGGEHHHIQYIPYPVEHHGWR